MNEDTEGMLISTSCVIMSLMRQLQLKGVLTVSDTKEIMDYSELYLAGMAPDLMSPAARDYAKAVIQDLIESSRALDD